MRQTTGTRKSPGEKIVKDASTATIFKGSTPFWVADIFRLALLVALPAFALLMPMEVVNFAGL